MLKILFNENNIIVSLTENTVKGKNYEF